MQSVKAILIDGQSWYYIIHTKELKRVHTFSLNISPKVNVIAGLEFELGYNNLTFLHSNHNAMRTSLMKIVRMHVCVFLHKCYK